jgi:hypothetical protein
MHETGLSVLEQQDLNQRPLRPERCYLLGNTNKISDS